MLSNLVRWVTRAGVLLATLGGAPSLLVAAEHVTLRNGFEIDCARRETIEGGRVRLFMLPSTAFSATTPATTDVDASYLDVASDSVIGVEVFPDPEIPVNVSKLGAKPLTELTSAEMNTMLAKAGTQHHIDQDLLASVVKAESGGRVTAVSRTGARGLMQLMPGTASEMGVSDVFRPEQNIAGGTAYLDQLLVRYRDNVAFALAAYNAGPAAVDKYHGVPPYRETRAYVARVIREFNRRKTQAAAQTNAQSRAQLAGWAR